MEIFWLLLGFIMILVASNVLVDAASSIALKLRVPKMLVALTIVAFGTCAPEVAISFQSVEAANGQMAFANVIGSCIVNVFLILGLASCIRQIKVKHTTIKKELPILLIVTTGFVILMVDSLFNPLTKNTFSRADALILLLLFCLFVLYLIQLFVRRKNKEEETKTKYSFWVAILLLILSLFFISFSSDLIVKNAELIATNMRISQKIITMILIVIGTSLPELFMTVTSAFKGEFDLAIGNIIGTNIFNICIVLGLPILIYGDIVLNGFGFIDILFVFLSSFFLFWFARTEKTLSQKEGIFMIVCFILYYATLFFM